jgi:hypothetical protein
LKPGPHRSKRREFEQKEAKETKGQSGPVFLGGSFGRIPFARVTFDGFGL